MDIDPRNYPSRTFVRFIAQNQLQADATGQPIKAAIKRLGGTYIQQAMPGGELPFLAADSNTTGGGISFGFSLDSSSTTSWEADSYATNPSIDEVDADLFEEIVKTTFSPSRYPALYQSCGTQKAAAEVEAKVATEIVAAYRQISQKQDCLIVQRLNDLL